MTQGSSAKTLDGFDAGHYIEAVLGIEQTSPGAAEFLLGATTHTEIEAAARQDFERAERIEDLAYPHVLKP